MKRPNQRRRTSYLRIMKSAQAEVYTSQISYLLAKNEPKVNSQPFVFVNKDHVDCTKFDMGSPEGRAAARAAARACH